MPEPDDVVMAIDPGSSKCGVAVVQRIEITSDADSLSTPAPRKRFEILHRRVAATSDIDKVISELAARYSPGRIIVGDGTTSSRVVDVARDLQSAPVELVDEKFSSLLARKRYFKENPPRGLRRLIPISLQTPPRPYDDYVALILAERYLSA